MLQFQASGERHQESPAYLARDGGSKWWHVPDGQIEDMIRRLNDPSDAPSASKPQGSVLRDRSSTGSKSSSVQFNFHDQHEDTFNHYEDALDRELMGNNQAKKEKGSWKVPDAKLLDFIESAKKVLATEAEETSNMLEANTVPTGRTSLGNAGGRVVTGRNPPAVPTGSKTEGNQQAAQGIAQPSSVRSRNSRGKRNLSTRPPWVKSESMPNLFGVDPPGRRRIKAGMQVFEETPIYLGDAKDKCLERVRVNVCGHPYYM